MVCQGEHWGVFKLCLAAATLNTQTTGLLVGTELCITSVLSVTIQENHGAPARQPEPCGIFCWSH